MSESIYKAMNEKVMRSDKRIENTKELALKKIRNVYFFPNGLTACTDENGEQIGELQEAWLRLWINHAKQKTDITGKP